VQASAPERLRNWARRLKSEVVALWFCYRHPRTPFAAKALSVAVVAYALSPIDLIPDFIPVLGYLDDLIIVPAGVWLALKLVPADVMSECRAQATRWLEERRPRPSSPLATAVVVAFIVALWAALLWLAWRWAGSWLE